MIYCVTLEKPEQNKLLDNSFGGQTYVTMYMTYAQNVIHVKEQNVIVRNMDIYPQRKQKLILGKHYVLI